MDRTLLANERTLLAYVRTALALLLAGVTFVHFSEAMWLSIVGVVCLLCGAVTLTIGIKRYLDMHNSLKSLRDAVPGIAEAEKKLIAELTPSSDEPESAGYRPAS